MVRSRSLAPSPRRGGTRRATRPSRTPLQVLLVALLLVVVAPQAQAALSDPVGFQGDLHVPAAQTGQESFLLLSGELTLDVAFTGPVFGMRTAPGTTFAAETLRVYNVNDPTAVARQTPHLELRNATLTPEIDASFFWSVPRGNVTGHSAYTFGFLHNIEENLPEMGFFLPDRNGTAPPSLIAQAPDEAWTFDAPGAARSIYYPVRGGFVVTGADGTSETFAGDDWFVSLRGATTANVRATGIAVPFEAGAEVHLTPASGSDFAAGFSVDRLQRFLGLTSDLAEGFEPPSSLPDEGSDPCFEDPRLCDNETLRRRSLDRTAAQPPGGAPDDTTDDNTTDDDTTDDDTTGDGNTTDGGDGGFGDGTPDSGQDLIPAEAAQALEQIAPLLNGALFGQPDAEILVRGERFDDAGLSIVRFHALTLTATDATTIGFTGSGPFVFTAGEVHHDADVFRLGPIVIPLLSVFLYLIAIGAYVATRIQTFRPIDEERTRRLWVPALITQWGLIVVSFILFDREVHYVLGQSLLGALGVYGDAPAAVAHGAVMAMSGVGMVAVLQLALWASASAAFGVPIGLLGRSILKAAGFGKATNGFAIGIGAFFTWLLGTAIILPVLDVLFGAVAGAAG